MEADRTVALVELLDTGLFDPVWYLARNQDVAASGFDPMLHFMRFGIAERRDPNRYFDVRWYERENPDLAGSDLPPFQHYVLYGDREGRRPHPLFDPGWYRRTYGLAEDVPALAHFLANRYDGMHAPGPELMAVTLMPEWRGEDAVDRYLTEMDRIAPGTLPDRGIVSASGLLDPNHYLINASDVHESGLDAIDHYCRFGWRENRQPNVYFDPEWYIATNPDLDRGRMNPLVHYVLVGEPAGRRPVVYFDPVWYRQTYDVPPDRSALWHFLTYRRGQTVSPNALFDVAWYVERNRDALGPNRDPFAHYLQMGTVSDVDPSEGFNARAYRRRFLGRPSRGFTKMMRPDRHNPLVHFLRTHYR